MKIRQGFVSNSSSSSFICLGTKEAYDFAMKQCKGAEKEVIKNFTVKGKIGNVEVKGLSYGTGNNGDAVYDRIESIIADYDEKYPPKETDIIRDQDVDDEDGEGHWGIFNRFQQNMSESGNIFEHSEDF